MNNPTSPTLVTFASPKGGVGKSTTCVSLAGALTARGYPVHIIDLDQTATLIRWYTHHKPNIPLLSVETVAEPELFKHLTQLMREKSGFILLDLAGALSLTMLQAAAVAHLTITPAKLSEPDIVEATKLHHRLRQLATTLGRPITHRVVINEVSSILLATYQKHALDQLEASPLERFHTLLRARAPYAEVFLTGQPAHYADTARPPVQKAVDEIDALLDEVMAVLRGEPNAVTEEIAA